MQASWFNKWTTHESSLATTRISFIILVSGLFCSVSICLSFSFSFSLSYLLIFWFKGSEQVADSLPADSDIVETRWRRNDELPIIIQLLILWRSSRWRWRRRRRRRGRRSSLKEVPLWQPSGQVLLKADKWRFHKSSTQFCEAGLSQAFNQHPCSLQTLQIKSALFCSVCSHSHSLHLHSTLKH